MLAAGAAAAAVAKVAHNGVSTVIQTNGKKHTEKIDTRKIFLFYGTLRSRYFRTTTRSSPIAEVGLC